MQNSLKAHWTTLSSVQCRATGCGVRIARMMMLWALTPAHRPSRSLSHSACTVVSQPISLLCREESQHRRVVLAQHRAGRISAVCISASRSGPEGGQAARAAAEPAAADSPTPRVLVAHSNPINDSQGCFHTWICLLGWRDNTKGGWVGRGALREIGTKAGKARPATKEGRGGQRAARRGRRSTW